jgi:hypothetical protein
MENILEKFLGFYFLSNNNILCLTFHFIMKMNDSFLENLTFTLGIILNFVSGIVYSSSHENTKGYLKKKTIVIFFIFNNWFLFTLQINTISMY